MIKAIFFDLDGTLIDSAPDLADALNFTLQKLGKEPFHLESIREWIGGGARLLLQRALSGKKEIHKIEPILYEKAQKIFFDYYNKNLCNKTVTYPNAKELLEKLRPSYHLALITNKPERFVAPILEHLELNYFDLIIGGDTLKEKKPSALPLLYACSYFQISPQEAIMVGDSINDTLAAKRATITSILVDYGYESEEIESDYKISNLLEVLEVI